MKNRPGEKLKLMSVDQLLGVPDTEGSTEIEVPGQQQEIFSLIMRLR